MMKFFNKKLKTFFNDSLWSIAALVLMNLVSQFVVYPLWARVFGDEKYGNIVYLMSFVNIFAVSVGISANYCRMRESAFRKTCRNDYNIMVLVGSVVSAVLCFFIALFSNFDLALPDAFMIAVLCFLTVWRYYADVEYRLALNYKQYFLYYAAISAGYLLGILLFYCTNCWALTLIPGEAVGVLLVLNKGRVNQDHLFEFSANFKGNLKSTCILIVTNLLSNIIFNGDRVLLQWTIGGTAVTIYYLSSLVGKTMSLITTPLNSVIIGHLARYKGKIDRKFIHLVFALSAAAVVCCTAACVVGSYILIYILYPQNFESVKQFFWIASATQVIYFTSNVITTVLLRIADTNVQLTVNIVYALSFLILCIPATLFFGISGFCISLLFVNLVRYAVSIGFCYIKVK